MARGRSPAGAADRRLRLAVAASLVALAAVFGVGAVRGPGLAFDGYPVAATDWLDENGYLRPRLRVATQDVVGDYFLLRLGRSVPVFIDDRFDMYPVAVTRDYITLLRGESGASRTLDRYGVDAVLWERQRPLATILRTSAEWRQAFAVDGWVVLVRAPSPSSGRPGRLPTD